EVVPALVSLEADLLFGYDVDVLRVPDFDAGRLFVLSAIAGGSCFLRPRGRRRSRVGRCRILDGLGERGRRLRLALPLLDPEEDGGAVVRPLQRTEVDDAGVRRETVDGRGIELEARPAAAGKAFRRQDRVGRLLVERVDAGAQDGEVVGVLAPGEVGVGGGIGVERAKGAVGRVVNLHPVAGVRRGVDGEGEERAFVLPAEFGDVAEVGVDAAG